MAFHAKYDGRYWDADVERRVCFESPWSIKEPYVDDKANNMHEAVDRIHLPRQCGFNNTRPSRRKEEKMETQTKELDELARLIKPATKEDYHRSNIYWGINVPPKKYRHIKSICTGQWRAEPAYYLSGVLAIQRVIFFKEHTVAWDISFLGADNCEYAISRLWQYTYPNLISVLEHLAWSDTITRY